MLKIIIGCFIFVGGIFFYRQFHVVIEKYIKDFKIKMIDKLKKSLNQKDESE